MTDLLQKEGVFLDLNMKIVLRLTRSKH